VVAMHDKRKLIKEKEAKRKLTKENPCLATPITRVSKGIDF
jgi:hypothetical protein